jgi:hypothetical protein
MSLSRISTNYQSSISSVPSVLRYVIWCCLFFVSLGLFFLGMNKNSFISVPVEVFSIIMAATLVASSYILQLKNIWFKFGIWMALLGSTVSVVWLVMLYVAHPFGTEITVILYGLISYFIFWLFIRKKDNK